MLLPNPFQNLFNHKPISEEEQRQKSSINALITYCISLINREDLVFETVEQFHRLNSRHGDLDVMQYMSVYIALEQFISGNKKPTVKTELSRQKLREEIKKYVNIEHLPALFRVLFISNKYQRISLYEIGTKIIMKEVERTFGAKFLTDTYAKEVRGTILQNTLQPDGTVSFASVYKDAQLISDEQITFAFKKLFGSFFSQINASVGFENARKPFSDFYQLVKRNYEYDQILDVTVVLPPEITKEDRLEFLSKEELKKQVIEATGQLQNERDQAKIVVDSIGEGLFVIDNELKVVQINPAACRLLEVTQETAVGKYMGDIFPLFQNNATLLSDHRPLTNVLRGGSGYVSAVVDGYSTRSKKGKIFPITFSATPIRRKGRIIGAVEVFQNITQTHQYEQDLRIAKETVEQKVIDRTRQLRETQNRLFTFLDKMPVGVIIFDQGGRLNFANSSIVALFNRIIDEDVLVIGNSVREVFSKVSLCSQKERVIIPSERNPLLQAFTGKPLHSRDISMQSSTVSIPTEIIATPVFNEQGRVNFVIVVVKDVTEEVIVERSKDEFFSIASHELRTPLTAIRGNTSLIQEYFGTKFSDPQLKEMIEDIHQSSVQLIGIINDFLNVSRLEQGKISFAKQTFDMRELAKDVVFEYEKSAREKGILLFCDKQSFLSGQKTTVMADKIKTKEVLVNLIGNAIKYTERGGVMVCCSYPEGYLRVRIADTGRGISDDGRLLLFRKFQQTGDDIYTRDTTKSTGLGLYISKMIMEGMGGKVFLEYSKPGKGSIFAVDLPLVKS